MATGRPTNLYRRHRARDAGPRVDPAHKRRGRDLEAGRVGHRVGARDRSRARVSPSRAMSESRAERLQRAYYASNAASYDAAHLGAAEHQFALEVMLAGIRHYGFRSVLDV